MSRLFGQRSAGRGSRAVVRGRGALKATEIDADTVRVSNPDPKQPDTIVRRFGGKRTPEKVREYKARKDK